MSCEPASSGSMGKRSWRVAIIILVYSLNSPRGITRTVYLILSGGAIKEYVSFRNPYYPRKLEKSVFEARFTIVKCSIGLQNKISIRTTHQNSFPRQRQPFVTLKGIPGGWHLHTFWHCKGYRHIISA